MDFSSSGGLNGKMQFSNYSAGQKFAKAVKILIKHAATDSQLNPIASYADAKSWPSIAFLSCVLLFGASLGAVGSLTSSVITAAVDQAKGYKTSYPPPR